MDANDFKSKLKKRRKELGLTLKEVAKAVGVSEGTVSRWESGNIANMGRDKIYSLSKVLALSPTEIMGFEDAAEEQPEKIRLFSIPNIIPLPSTKEIPLLGTIACGEPILAEENIEDYVKVNKNISAEFALRCKGDSMIDARIRSGDIVYIHQQPDVENGEIAAVLIGNEATLKRVFKYPEKNMLMLRPANSSYEDLIYTGDELNDIRIIGKAVAFLSQIC